MRTKQRIATALSALSLGILLAVMFGQNLGDTTALGWIVAGGIALLIALL